MAAATATDVQKAYLAYFGRPADPVGLAYWTGKDTATMKAGFAASAEYATLYAGMTSAQMVAQVYTNLLGRTAEAAGLLYWSNALANGTATVSTLVDQMQANALGDDVTTINNRVTYATAFTAALDTTAEIVGYSGTTAANAARAAVLPITTDASLTTATAALNASVSTVTTASTSVSSGVVGQTYTLTSGTDTLSPSAAAAASQTTANDDTIRVVVAGDLASVDYVDGGAGNDTMNVSAALVAAIKPVIKNVETLNVMFAAGGQVDLADSSGYTAVNSKASTALGAVGSGDFVNIALGTTVGVVDSNVGAVFGFAGVTGAADSATLTVADAAAAAPVTIADVENVTINSVAGSVAATTANSIALTAAAAETITVTGSQAITLALSNSSPSATTVNASALTKGLTLTMTGVAAATTAAVSITGTGAADTVTLTEVAAGSKFTVDLGAGSDTLGIGSTAFHKITTGAGSDTINLNTNTNAKAMVVTSAATLAASVIEITDFTSGTDVLNITSGGAGTEITTLTGTNLANIAASSNLLTATTAAVGYAAADGDAVVFQYGGDTYVIVNESGADATLGTSDVLIKLTGVTSTVAADVTVA